jgi:hypothetical protein
VKNAHRLGQNVIVRGPNLDLVQRFLCPEVAVAISLGCRFGHLARQ